MVKKKNRMPIFNPRASTPWSQDDTKFGQRMLEKMGWKKGEGLGTHSQGITENIKLNLKLNSKGLGFKVSDQDQWLKVEHSFSDVLSRLNEVQDTDVVTTQSSSNFTKSLESESMKSRSRVHYRKFTRGKDVSRYNEKDLLGILGQNTKRSTEENAELQYDVVFQSKEQNVVHDECSEIERSVNHEIDMSLPKENSQPKMSDRSSVKLKSISSDAATDANSEDANVIDIAVMKIKKTKKRRKSSLIVETDIIESVPLKKRRKSSLIVETDVIESVPSKKKKSKVIEESNINSNLEDISRDVSVPEDVNNASLNTAHTKNEILADGETRLPASNIDESQFERRKQTRAERIVERNILLKKLLRKDVSHEFTGSNLTNISGYGNCGTV